MKKFFNTASALVEDKYSALSEDERDAVADDALYTTRFAFCKEPDAKVSIAARSFDTPLRVLYRSPKVLFSLSGCCGRSQSTWTQSTARAMKLAPRTASAFPSRRFFSLWQL
jgi:hypothetical protein